MKAVLNIPDKDVKFEFDNLTYKKFMMLRSRPSNINPFIVERYTSGEPITLITSNMPADLLTSIEQMISEYCNHNS